MHGTRGSSMNGNKGTSKTPIFPNIKPGPTRSSSRIGDMVQSETSTVEMKIISTTLSVEQHHALQEFKLRELQKRKLDCPKTLLDLCPSTDQQGSSEQMNRTRGSLDGRLTTAEKLSTAHTVTVLDHERVLYEQFVQFASGAVAFQSSATLFKVSRFGIEFKEEKIATKQGLLSSEGKRKVTMDLRECLEFCKSVGIIPVLPGPKNDRFLKSYKIDVSSVEYMLLVRVFKEVENDERELDFTMFTRLLSKMFADGLVFLNEKLKECVERRGNLEQKMLKYLQSTPNPHKRIKEIFSEIFDSVYEAFVFFDIDGSWQVRAATFLHMCKNVLCLPMTNADLKLTLEEVCWLQSISAHDFVQAFAWHTLEEKGGTFRIELPHIPDSEQNLYKAFRFFCEYRPKGISGSIPSQSEVLNWTAKGSCCHMAFQQYVEFLKFVEIVPSRTVRSITGDTFLKTDVGSSEYEVAVKAFRDTVKREDLMEWMEFKECLFYTIRGGARRLKKELLRAKNHLFTMRARLSHFAPSVTNPFQALKLALRTRFDSVFDAFVYFDIDGSWAVSVPEFKSMVKGLALTLTSNDIDAALREICGPNATTFSASEFCTKLNWADAGSKEAQRFQVLEHEVELFELFESFCRRKEWHSNPAKPSTEPLSPGRGQFMNLSEFLEFAKFTDLMPVEVQLKQESSTDRYSIAVRVFNSVNWTNEKEGEISWPEFKEVIYQYFKSGPKIAREILAETEEELQSKYTQFCDNIVSVADPIVALKNTLRTRFNNVFDAFVFMDLNGDWEVSANEMTMAFHDLALGLTRADLFAVIRRIMKRSTVDAALVISPHEFVKVLAWHPRPSQGGIQGALEAAKSNREATATLALQKSQENPFPKPKPSFQHLRAEDAEEYRRLELNVVELKKIINELEKTFTFRNIQLELLAMSEEDKEQRRHNARMRMRERAAQLNEKTMHQLLDESKARRNVIITEAARRTRDNRDAPQRYLSEPPPVETLLMYACKRDKDAMIAQMEVNNKFEAAIKKLCSVNMVLGVPVRDLPMSAKERFARNEVLMTVREERRKALLGVEKIAGQFIEEAKRNRTSIYDSAIGRAKRFQREASIDASPSDTVMAVFEWIRKRARSAVMASVSQRVAPQGSSSHIDAYSFQISTGTVSKMSAIDPLNSNVGGGIGAHGACDRTASNSGSQSHELTPIILSHDVFRFGRKRDFDLLESTCREVVSLQLAISHLESVRDQGLFGVHPNMLSRESRIKLKVASIPEDIASKAAVVLQRLCRSRVVQNRQRDPLLKRSSL